MPSLTSLARLLRIGTLPETRALIASTARSRSLRDLRRRATVDRAGLMRDLRERAHARGLVRRAAGHPATHELAAAGLMLLPVRFMPVGLAATWAAQRIRRRGVGQPLAGQVEPGPGEPATAGQPVAVGPPVAVTPPRPV